MTQTTYREDGKTKCPACLRNVAAVHDNHGPETYVSRHLYQERVELNEVGAPTKFTPGFCPGSFEKVKLA